MRGIKYIFVIALAAALFSSFFVASVYAEQETLCDAEKDVMRETAQITVSADGKTFVYTDKAITPSDFTVAEEIELRNINSPLDRKIELADMYLSKGADYKTALKICFPRLIFVVDEVSAYLKIEPIDAKVTYDNGKFRVSKHKKGRALDENKLYASIYCALKFSGGGAVNATALDVAPSVTESELKRNLVLRGEYTTDFSSSSSDRAHNVTLALKKFDGMELPAGETLSFNDTVGDRTAENGFKSAKIIVDGKYTDGVGGGVCQSSTALYNAALLAGLDCSANAHSICPSYCPAGLDAMISSVSDLRIRNNSERSVYFSVRVASGRATVTIFGAPAEYDIVPESVTVKTVKHEELETVDEERKYFGANAVCGDRMLVALGKDGVLSETYLKYYKNGKFIKRVKIRANEYKPVPQIIAVAP